MFQWLRQKFIAFFAALCRAFLPFMAGVMVTLVATTYAHMQAQQDRLVERLPEVRECDAQQLPPNATNLRSLGNGWLLFDMDVNGDKKTFIYRRGYKSGQYGTQDQPDVFTQIK